MDNPVNDPVNDPVNGPVKYLFEIIKNNLE